VAATIRIGTSGWHYDSWRGPFYPPGTAIKGQFAYYATRFSTTEINNSFYRLPSEAAVASWREAAPHGFVFAWKASRFITHFKRLKECEDSIALVFGRMDGLGESFGPVLFQLPPQFKPDRERLAGFLDLLPKSRRIAFEFRDPGWYAADILDLLRAHDVSLCLSDHAHAPAPWEVTASFVYVRPHGPGGRYAGSYDDATLRGWARTMHGWQDEGRDVFCYFDNDQKSAAPFDAERLIGFVEGA